jgi:hypothetical protein
LGDQIKEDEKYSYTLNLAGRLEGKSPLRKPKTIWEDNIETDNK